MKLPSRGKILDMLALPLCALVSATIMWLAVWKLTDIIRGWIW